jgi:hypothetical protein
MKQVAGLMLMWNAKQTEQTWERNWRNRTSKKKQGSWSWFVTGQGANRIDSGAQLRLHWLYNNPTMILAPQQTPHQNQGIKTQGFRTKLMLAQGSRIWTKSSQFVSLWFFLFASRAMQALNDAKKAGLEKAMKSVD